MPVVPGSGGQACLCVAFLGGKKHTKTIPRKSQENDATVPGQSRDNPGTIMCKFVGTKTIADPKKCFRELFSEILLI